MKYESLITQLTQKKSKATGNRTRKEKNESSSWLQIREMPRHDTKTSLGSFHAWVGKMPPNAAKIQLLYK
jgi:hypothetical protein